MVEQARHNSKVLDVCGRMGWGDGLWIEFGTLELGRKVKTTIHSRHNINNGDSVSKKKTMDIGHGGIRINTNTLLSYVSSVL